MHFIIPYIVGVSIGVPIAIWYSGFRTKPFPVRLVLGLLVGFGIAVVINASLEVAEVISGRNPRTVNVSNVKPKSAPSAVTTKSAAAGESSIPKSWKQEQRYDDGKLKAIRTVTRDEEGNLIPHGPASTFFPNGLLKWTGTFEMGKQVGSWTEHYPDGKKEGEGLIRGDGNAVETHWHNNGKQKSQGSWLHGVKHGGWMTWYSSGQEAGIYQYDRGQLHGEVREWHENGRKKLEAIFEHGAAASPLKRWDVDGRVLD